MSEPKAQSEPTMEEILASIRRIISENDDGATPAEAKPAAPAAEDDQVAVLELTEMVADDGSVVSLNQRDETDEDAAAPPPPAPQPSAESPQPVEVSMDETKDDAVEFAADEPSPAPGGGETAPDGLLSAASAAAATAAFAALARNKPAAEAPAPAGNIPLGAGRTLEELVQDMLRPMLKDWLDANLPPLVERLVRKELERLARRAEE